MARTCSCSVSPRSLVHGLAVAAAVFFWDGVAAGGVNMDLAANVSFCDTRWAIMLDRLHTYSLVLSLSSAVSTCSWNRFSINVRQNVWSDSQYLQRTPSPSPSHRTAYLWEGGGAYFHTRTFFFLNGFLSFFFQSNNFNGLKKIFVNSSIFISWKTNTRQPFSFLNSKLREQMQQQSQRHCRFTFCHRE